MVSKNRPWPLQLQRPRDSGKAELAWADVTVVNPDGLTLECKRCLTQWSPALRPGVRLPRGYWRCPSGCNADAVR